MLTPVDLPALRAIFADGDELEALRTELAARTPLERPSKGAREEILDALHATRSAMRANEQVRLEFEDPPPGPGRGHVKATPHVEGALSRAGHATDERLRAINRAPPVVHKEVER